MNDTMERIEEIVRSIEITLNISLPSKDQIDRLQETLENIELDLSLA